MADPPDGPHARAERRKLERTAVLWSGSLVYDGEDADCVIVNISAEGALARMAGPVVPTGSVSLRCPRFGNLAATVVWQRESEIGLQFRDRPEFVTEILDRALK